MKKNFVLIACLFFLCGCSSTAKTVKPREAHAKINSDSSQPPPPAAESPVPVPKGIVFAKTIFQGVVRTSYVRLGLVNVIDPQKILYLYIGDKAQQQSFPWVGESVHPDYFLIDLPAGQYQIFELAIPVGTVLAQEPMDITFTVEADKGIYLGTLLVNGTKERVKFGGIPLIKPGFKYEIEVRDERDTALADFRRRVPDFHEPIKVQLMQVHDLNRFGLINAEGLKYESDDGAKIF